MSHVGVDELLEAEVALVGQVGVQAPLRYPPAHSMNMTNMYRDRAWSLSPSFELLTILECSS